MNLPIRKKGPAAGGFSLVATVLMLSLLVVLVLGLTSLSTVSLRTASHDAAALRAKANARLALQTAIGELQRLAGPDGRVTAPSDVVVGEGGRGHLTGVWEGWKWDGNGSTPDWDKEKSDRFKGWLVSAAGAGSAGEESFVTRPQAAESVKLVDAEEQSGQVSAGVVRVPGSRGRTDGGIAWAVFDQSQKANITVPPAEDDESFSAAYDRLASASVPGYGAVREKDWKALAERAEQRPGLVTLGQSRLVGLKKRDASFHDLTSSSTGLLTNVAGGGFAGDLSRLFDAEALPADFASRFLYSGTDSPLVPPPARFKNANPLPSPDPSWALLHSHYRAYTRVAPGAGNEIAVSRKTLDPRNDPKNPMSGTEDILRNKAFNNQQIAPVIAKAQFVFSLTFGVNQNTLSDMWARGAARSSPPSLRDNYITWLVIDPVITLWNPYNVPIRFEELSIELHRIPLAFRLYKNGARLADNYTRLTDAHTTGDFQGRKNKYYFLKLLPETGKGSVQMQPGEHIVFTGHEWRKHGNHDYKELGLTMRPGFNPPAGASSSPEIGGVTTQNLFVSPTGTSTGKDYNKTIRTVAVKGGDQIQVEVKPERAGADDLPEAGGREVTGFLKYYSDATKDRKLIGGIELDYGDKEKELLPEYGRYDLPTIVVNSAIPKTAPNSTAEPEEAGADMALRWKEPFLIATFQQKTERDSRWPSRSWVNNAPGNLYSSAGLDEHEDYAHQQYEFKWEPMTDWPPDSPTIEISTERNRGYGASGVYAQSGTEIATFSSIPLAPAHSLGQFSHAPLNAGGQLPLTTRPVGNSFSSPLIPEGKVRENSGSRTLLDHSYLANNALFDSWFLSTAADHPGLPGGNARDAKTLLRNFFGSGKPLPNARFRPYLDGAGPEELADRLGKDPQAYRHIAENLLLDAPFNVNSTSVAAWQALLASNFGKDVPLADASLDGGNDLPVSRNLPATGSAYESGAGEGSKWSGYRRLSEDQIEALSKAIVEQVKKRGPFQSMAEFVNRRPGDGESARSGAIQSAIEAAGINEALLDPELSAGATGNTADGAPGVITQADLLTPLLPQLTARGDTFVVRAYGEAANPDGTKSRAWCEATVQRYPEYVDPTDEPSATPSTDTNKAFGRRFQLVSFRWLKPGEI